MKRIDELTDFELQAVLELVHRTGLDDLTDEERRALRQVLEVRPWEEDPSEAWQPKSPYSAADSTGYTRGAWRTAHELRLALLAAAGVR